jgi:hypothetical protein
MSKHKDGGLWPLDTGIYNPTLPGAPYWHKSESPHKVSERKVNILDMVVVSPEDKTPDITASFLASEFEKMRDDSPPRSSRELIEFMTSEHLQILREMSPELKYRRASRQANISEAGLPSTFEEVEDTFSPQMADNDQIDKLLEALDEDGDMDHMDHIGAPPYWQGGGQEVSRDGDSITRETLGSFETKLDCIEDVISDTNEEIHKVKSVLLGEFAKMKERDVDLTEAVTMMAAQIVSLAAEVRALKSALQS